MKDLTIYIEENSNPLDIYMINEGLLNWLKRFWKWLWDDSEDKVKEKGCIFVSEKTKKAFKKGSCDDNDFSFGQMKNTGDQSFEKYVSLEQNKKTANFINAKEFYNSNKKAKIFSIRLYKECIGFVFCNLKKKNILEVIKIILAQEIIEDNKNIKNSNVLKQLGQAFTKYIKQKYSKFKLEKFNTSVVDTKINKNRDTGNTDNAKDDNTNKQKAKETIEKITQTSVEKQTTNGSKKQETNAEKQTSDSNKQKFEEINLSFEEKDIQTLCKNEVNNKKWQNVLLKFYNAEKQTKDKTFRNFVVYNTVKSKKLLIGVIFGEIVKKEQIKISNCYFNPEITNKYDLTGDFTEKLAKKQVEFFDNHKDFYLYTGNDILGEKIFNKEKFTQNTNNDKTEDYKDEKIYHFYNEAKNLLKKNNKFDRFLKILKGNTFKTWKDNSDKKDYSKLTFDFEYIDKYDLDKLISKLESFKPQANFKNLKKNEFINKKEYNHPVIIVKSKESENLIGLAITHQNITKGIKDKPSERIYFADFVWNTHFVGQHKKEIDNIEFASALLYSLYNYVQNNKYLLESEQISLTNYILEHLDK